MPRPKKCRRVCHDPGEVFYKPASVPLKELEFVSLSLDELEAIRLRDLEGLYQEDAAKSMNISRQTFGNILNSAHRKIADCLVNGKALKIEGGAVELKERLFTCNRCKYLWALEREAAQPECCPSCDSTEFESVSRGRRRSLGGCGRRWSQHDTEREEK